MQRNWVFLILTVYVLFAAAPGRAQGEAAAHEFAAKPVIRAGVYLSPPFAMKRADGSGYHGMAVELWNELGRNLGFQTAYKEYAIPDILWAVETGEIDVVISNVSVTHKRAGKLKFSYPWFDAGLRIMVNDDNSISVIQALHKSGHLYVYGVLCLVLLLLTGVFTVIRRRMEPEFPHEWGLGLASSFHDLIVGAKGGRFGYRYRNWAYCLVVALWLICGIGLITYITSTMTSTLTKLSIASSISSLYDLPKKKVGVLGGSAAHTVMLDMGVEVAPYPSIEAAVDALRNDDIAAIVADAPVLEYWDFIHQGAGMAVVGNLFRVHKYAFPANPRLGDFMDKVSLEIIRLHDTGYIETLRAKYFGRNNL